MAESKELTGPSISEELMRARLAQSEQMREFFLQMWMQNPLLAKRAGKRLQGLMAPMGPVASDEFLPTGES